jgi:hypothetical protein
MTGHNVGGDEQATRRIDAMATPPVYKDCYIVVKGVPSEREDADVPGVYLTYVETGFSDEQTSEIALDLFHLNVPIGMLDDFEIGVYDTAGAQLPEMDNYETLSLAHRGAYKSKMDESTTPSPVWQRFDGTRNPAP